MKEDKVALIRNEFWDLIGGEGTYYYSSMKLTK